MNFLPPVLIIIGLSWTDCQILAKHSRAKESTLELVHVLFRHGDRTPDKASLYPSSPYFAESHYYPYGYGQLTNEGKSREYRLGTALRKRYHKFLGKVFNMSTIDVRSTELDRTKMSAELMVAGLWPPSSVNQWNAHLKWQPIPYKYEKLFEDKELFSYIWCPRFQQLLNEVLQEPKMSYYLASRYNETLEILANNTGIAREEMTYFKACLLYGGFLIQGELNLPPLEEWISKVYPEPLHSLLIDYYYLYTNTTELKKIFSGYLLKKIISDTQHKINGDSKYTDRKMYAYAAHEFNIAGLLLSITDYKLTEMPPYGSCVLMEVHKIDEAYGMMVFYQHSKTHEPRLLKVKGCDEFCPMNEFAALVQVITPSSDEECYGSHEKNKNRAIIVKFDF